VLQGQSWSDWVGQTATISVNFERGPIAAAAKGKKKGGGEGGGGGGGGKEEDRRRQTDRGCTQGGM
jgi:hypothetical protein